MPSTLQKFRRIPWQSWLAGKLLLMSCSWISPATAAAPIRATVDARLINDPEVLEALERRGLALSALFGAKPGEAEDNQALAKASQEYRSIVESLSVDLGKLPSSDPQLAIGMARAHRLFDKSWLRSTRARYELVAVVNRLDRQPFAPQHCGETRLIYRLAYTANVGKDWISSRLPMTLNMVFFQRAGAEAAPCSAVAQQWLKVEQRQGEALASWLVGSEGPLAPAALDRGRRKSIEVNLQSVRWPSTTRGELGGHAEYFLRVFHDSSDPKKGLVPQVLENTPDVERILAKPALRTKLANWLTAPERLAQIDAGTFVLPDEFLASKATSVSPRGLTRLANRPFSRLFSEADFAATKLSGYSRIATPAAFLRRLDDASCTGCHQARAVAGFHVLGIDRADTAISNAVQVTGSPHLDRDLVRRQAYIRTWASGSAPDPARPLSERADSGEGGYGSHCGLGDRGFAAWTCDPEFDCMSVGNAKNDRTVGQCFPRGEARVGDPCENGQMRPHANPHRDRVVSTSKRACQRGVCEANYVGFPGGMCAVACDDTDKDVSCGAIAILSDFNLCLARAEPFTHCLTKHVRSAGLRACSQDLPCRDDYLCARTAGSNGACIPPYFLFQMRVDGHPKP